MSAEKSNNGSDERPSFRPPDGYTLRWQGKPKNGTFPGLMLLDPQGNQLGFFAMPQKRTEIADVLKACLTYRKIGEIRDEITVIIELQDSIGREVGAWDIQKEPGNPIEEMIKNLANR